MEFITWNLVDFFYCPSLYLMTEKKGPWHQDKKNSGFPLGVILWLGLFVFVGLLLWALFALFPDQNFSGNDTYIEIVRLIGILALVSSGLLYVQKIKVGEVIRNISIWTALAGILLLGYTYRGEISHIFYRVGGEVIPGQTTTSGVGEVMLTASADGHFYINGWANGKRIRFMIDTGASDITISPQAAQRIGIDLKKLRFTQRYRTANGIGLGAHHWIKVLSIGPFNFLEVKVSINQSELSVSLLGMAFLEQFNSFEFRGNKLYLRK